MERTTRREERLVYDADGQRVEVPLPLDTPLLRIGRAVDSDLQLGRGVGLSRNHAQLVRRPDGSLWLIDLGSSNGSFINGTRTPTGGEVAVVPGDKVRLGQLDLVLEVVDRLVLEREGEASEVARRDEPPTGRVGDRLEGEDGADPAPRVLSGDRERDERNVALLLETIADIHQHGGDPAALLVSVVDRVIELTRAERGLLLLRGDEDRSAGLETTVARTREGDDIAQVEGTSQSVPRQVLETGEAVCITGNPDWEQASQSMLSYDLRSLLCVPIRQGGSVSGVIYVDSQEVATEFGEQERVFLQALAAQCGVALERSRLLQEEVDNRLRLEEEHAALSGGDLVRPLAVSAPMQDVIRRVERVSGSDVSLLITGETGVGKEVIARYAHQASHRSHAPFVVADCGAIPETLIESVLFGHMKGAFTGATGDAEGLFLRAHGGTLLLDEIGELPLLLQPKLLRFLEERTFLPVGSSERRVVDVRVIACTHRDLQAMVAAGTFRQDLYYRLSTFPLQIPPLRERREDVVPLARLYLARERGPAGARSLSGFTHEALESLRAHDWPGNVRELAQRIRRAAVVAEPPFVTVTDLDLRAAPDGAVGVLPLPVARKQAQERFEREYVSELLRRHQGQVQKAAQEAGVSRQMFGRLVSRHGIDREAFKP
jgi:transcriptional regulator with GAF, ATPase, and Fis domain